MIDGVTSITVSHRTQPFGTKCKLKNSSRRSLRGQPVRELTKRDGVAVMSKATHDNDTDNTRYRCPLDGSPLMPADPGWFCPHHNHESSAHSTLIAYDEELECVVRQHGVGAMPVLPDEGNVESVSVAAVNKP